MEEKKILKNYISYFLVGLLICLVGISGVFADTSIDTSSWVNVTGRQWSLGTQDYHIGDLTIDTNWVKNYYNVPSGYFTPPNSYDYITFSFFQHYGNTNPCDGANYTAIFKLKLTNTNFLNYINKVQFIDNICNIVTDTNNGEVTATCMVNYEPVSNSYLSIYFNEISGNTTSDLYLSRTINFTCGLNTQAIIDSNNQNTQNIINNNNQNTQSIIDSSASNTQAIIDSNKVCSSYDLTNTIENKTLDANGNAVDNNTTNVSNYIKLSTFDELYLLQKTSTIQANYCFYNTNKTKISCYSSRNQEVGKLTIPDNTNYFRYTIHKSQNLPTYKICKNGSQALDESITSLDDTLNDSDIDNSDAVDFFSNFDDNTHGLSGIISAPLVAINSMLDNQCSPQTATWKGQTVSLPCGYDFWNRLSTFKQFLNVALDGLICYRILVKLFKLIETIKNPEDDRVEVMDL